MTDNHAEAIATIRTALLNCNEIIDEDLTFMNDAFHALDDLAAYPQAHLPLMDILEFLKVRGVGRVADEPRSFIVATSEVPTDEDIRGIHEALCLRATPHKREDER